MDIGIEAFLRGEGYTSPEAVAIARQVLEAAGLTRPGKQRMHADKLAAAQAALETLLTKACLRCLPRAATEAAGREVVEVPDESCPLCRGSDNRRSAAEMVADCQRHGVSRLLIVGGTATLHAHMEALLHELGAKLSLRFVDGAEAIHTRNEATAHLQWAQLVVIWGSTPLPHKVSQLYTHHPLAARVKTVTVTQRGIAGLCQQVRRALVDM